MSPEGFAALPSSYGSKETMGRLAAAVAKHGMAVLARIDHASALRTISRASGPNSGQTLVQKETMTMDTKAVKSRQSASLGTPNDAGSDATKDIAAALNLLLADIFALYLKTKNFHWHMSGSHFRDYHLLLDEQADQIFGITDPIAERVRKLGGKTLHSIGNIKRLQRILDNDADYVTPGDMLAELRDDNRQLAKAMRETHGVCDKHGDVATTSLLEVWIDEAEKRTWFLFEAGRDG